MHGGNDGGKNGNIRRARGDDEKGTERKVLTLDAMHRSPFKIIWSKIHFKLQVEKEGEIQENLNPEPESFNS